MANKETVRPVATYYTNIISNTLHQNYSRISYNYVASEYTLTEQSATHTNNYCLINH